jgi:tetratricopeptide (TPR) repeat protein
VQIGSALGRSFSHELISAVAVMSQDKLNDALDQLVRAELLFRRGTPPDAEYTFKHALVQDAAYGTLLRSRRQQIHARIAATLEGEFSEVVVAQPALLAQHCAEGGLMEKAIGYWLKAGRQAISRSAITEAVAQLRKGLDALASLPDGPWRQRHELELQIALANALAVTKGYSAPDVEETIARARALAERIDQPEHVPLIGSQIVFHMVRAEHKLALSFAEQMEKIGKMRNDDAVQLMGRYLKGSTCLYLGELAAARALLEQCHSLADPVHRAFSATWPVDLYPVMLAKLAATLTLLGYIDQARLRLDEALSEARRLRHAQTLAEVLTAACGIDAMTRSFEMRRIEELLALSTEHNFPFFLGMGTARHGLSLTALSRGQEGLTLITNGLAEVRATGTVANTSSLLISLAAAYASLGQLFEGLNCLAEASQIIETTEERISEAVLHRVRGELFNAMGDQTAAEQSYHQGLAVAARQSAKLFELGAATSLARLWRDQGKRTQARDLLAPIYGWFTEGFDTVDLKQAKALLDELT